LGVVQVVEQLEEAVVEQVVIELQVMVQRLYKVVQLLLVVEIIQLQ